MSILSTEFFYLLKNRRERGGNLDGEEGIETEMREKKGSRGVDF